MSVKLLSEALSLKDLRDAGWSREDIAGDIGKSPAWVQVRLMILDLNVEVKKLFMNHNFTLEEVRRMYHYKDDLTKQVDLAKSILEVKARKKAAKEIK